MICETDRLYLRKWTHEDIESAQRLWGDPKVTDLITSTGILIRDEIVEKLEEQLRFQNEFGVQYWAVIEKKTGQIIGCSGLRPYSPSEKIFEIGFHIMSDFWGKGFATEAAMGVVIYAKNNLKLEKLFAGHNPENQSSRKVLEKIGFKYTHDEFYEPTGLMHPSYELLLQ